MAKKPHYKEAASEKQKKQFKHLLSDEEELVLVTGYSQYYTRNRFAMYMVIPGALFWLLGLGWAYWQGVNLGIGLLIGYFVSMLFALIKTIWMYHARRYLLTNRRVIIKHGFFTVQVVSALFDKVTHIEVEQGFIDRIIMHHGHITLHTSGMNKGELKLEFIEAPVEFKNILERLINREREMFGNPQGPIFTVEGELVD